MTLLLQDFGEFIFRNCVYLELPDTGMIYIILQVAFPQPSSTEIISENGGKYMVPFDKSHLCCLDIK